MDPSWPRDARFDHVLLVVVKLPSVTGPDGTPAGDQLWWLRLDEAGDTVVAAGPLLDPSSLPGGRFLHSPVAGTTADGGLALAYLSADRPRAGQWDLRTARLAFDQSGRPHALRRPGTALAGRCCSELPPTFSTDGSQVRVIQVGSDGRVCLVHAPIPESVPEDRRALAGPLVEGARRGRVPRAGVTEGSMANETMAVD